MIDIENITLALPQKILLQNFSGQIQAGQRVGIFGPNGAGKSTFLKALLGLFPLKSGSIRIAGKPVANASTIIAYLPQESEPLLLDYSVMGFLKLLVRGEKWGLPLLSAQDYQRCEAVLNQVKALHLKDQLLKKLSGGERKRIMLAGLLLNQPQILLLDEPLANLDPHYQSQLLQLLDELQRSLKLTVLITAHDFNPLLHLLDQVLFMGEGRAVLDTPENAIQSEVLSALYRTPLQVIALNGRKWVLAHNQENFLSTGDHCVGGDHVSI